MKIVRKIAILLAVACLHTVQCLSNQDNAECTTQQFRLRYHLSVHENWSNDPNGLVYYDGVYHFFFQYHPYSTQWGPMHWGHAISDNLVTWKQVDIALYPDDLGTIYSGSAVVDYGNSSGFQENPDIHPVIAIFTSNSDLAESQSIAYSNDKGMTFTKYEGNPVLSQQEGGEWDFRDPKVFKDPHTGNWAMALAVLNRIEFYGSEDLKVWRKLSEFGRNPEEGNHGGVWECPDLVELPRQDGSQETVWVLIVSMSGGGPNGGSGTQYFVGNWDGEKFNSLPWHPTQYMDYGPDNYAGVTFSNEPLNRTIFVGWMINSRYSGAIPTSTWRGQYTLPRQLSIHTLNATENQFRVKSQPPKEMETLRDPLQHIELSQELTVPPQTVVTVTEQAPFRNPSMEIEVTIEMQNEPRFTLCAFNSLREEVCFGYNATRWYLDRTKSGSISFDDQFQSSSLSTAPREVANEQVTIRMFVDTSSVEVFADDGLTVMTELFFPTEPLDQFYINHWSEAASGAELKVKRVDIWGLICGVQNAK